MDIKKQRCDARLGNLDSAQIQAVFNFCEHHSLNQGVSWLKENFSIQIGRTQLSDWLRKHRVESTVGDRLEEIRDFKTRLAIIGTELGAAHEIASTNVKMILKDSFKELGAVPGERNEKRLADYMNLAVRVEAIRLKERLLDLQTDKFKSSLQTKVQAGFEALATKIKSNPAALAKYRELREELKPENPGLSRTKPDTILPDFRDNPA